MHVCEAVVVLSLEGKYFVVLLRVTDNPAASLHHHLLCNCNDRYITPYSSEQDEYWPKGSLRQTLPYLANNLCVDASYTANCYPLTNNLKTRA